MSISLLPSGFFKGRSADLSHHLALVSTNTPRDKIGSALGILQSSTASGMVLGPFVGGLLADSIGYRSIFFITAGLCAVGGIAVLIGVRESGATSNEGTRFTVVDNIRTMFRH